MTSVASLNERLQRIERQVGSNVPIENSSGSLAERLERVNKALAQIFRANPGLEDLLTKRKECFHRLLPFSLCQQTCVFFIFFDMVHL